MAYNRLKLFWGALDIEHSDEHMYSAAQTKSGGTSAAPPGIGVRRAQCVFTRDSIGSGEDVVVSSLAFLNLTSGEPDDTWTDTDYGQLETRLSTFFSSVAGQAWSKIVLDQIRWYRIGPGVFPPNPPARVLDVNIPGTNANPLPPQIATSLTLKTAARKQWGRMYLPYACAGGLDSNGYITSSNANSLATAADTLMAGVQSDGFQAVIYSPTRGKAYTVESVQVDNLFDVIRSRRYDKPTLRVIKP